MNNTDINTAILETTVCVLKANAKLPQVLAHLAWAVEELDKYEHAFLYVFPRALYKHVYNTKKIDKNILKTTIKDVQMAGFLLRTINVPRHNEKLLIYMHHLCGSQLSNRDARKIVRRIFSSPAKELEELDPNRSYCQSLLSVGLDDEALDAIESIQQTVRDRIPTTAQQASMLQQLCDASQGVTGSFDSLNETFESFINVFKSTQEKVETKVTDIKDALAQFDVVPRLLSASAVAYAVYRLSTEVNKTNIALAVTAVGYAIYQIGIKNISQFLKDCGSNVFTLLSSILGNFFDTTKETPVSPQGFLDDFSFLTSIFTSWPKCTLNNLTSILRLSKDLPEFLSNTLDVIKQALDAGTNDYFGFTTAKTLFNQTDHLNVKFEELLQQFEARKLDINIENALRVDFLLKEYERSLCNLDGKHKTNLSRIVSSRVVILRKINSHFNTFLSVDKSFRKEPVCVMLTGPPGIYKTELSAQLIDIAIDISLGKGERQKSERHNLVYPRISTQEFWPGYPSTCEVVSMDDWGQLRDVVGSTANSFIDLIYLINTAPFLLNQASLEDKGKDFAKPNWVFGTTNCIEIKPYSLVDPKAIERRIDLFITPIPLPEYAKSSDINVIDPEKIKTSQEGVLDISVDKFMYKVVKNGRKDDITYVTFTRLCSLMQELHITKTKRFHSNIRRRAAVAEKVSDMLHDRRQQELDSLEHTRMRSVAPSFAQADWDLEMHTIHVSNDDVANENFDIFDSLDHEFLADDDFNGNSYAGDEFKRGFTDKLQVNFAYLHEDMTLDQRILNAREMLSVTLSPIARTGTILNDKIEKCTEAHSMMTPKAYSLLCSKIDEKWLMYYAMYYNLCASVYTPLTTEDLPPMFEGMNPFVFFCLMSNKDLKFGEMLFRRYKFSKLEIQGVTLLVAFDEPMKDKIKDYLSKKTVSLFTWIANLDTFPRMVFFYAVGYTTGKAIMAASKATIALFNAVYNMIMKMFAGGEPQSAQPRFEKSSKAAKVNLRDLGKSVVQGNDLSGFDMVKKISNSNTAFFNVEYRAEGHAESYKVYQMGSALFLDSDTIVIPEHYATMPQHKFSPQLENVWITLTNDKDEDIFEINYVEFLLHVYHTFEGDTHLIWWRLNKRIAQQKKDIRSYFLLDADIHSLSNDDLFVTMKLNSEQGAYLSSSATITSCRIADLKLAKAIEYRIDTGKGDCGVPLTLRVPRLGKRRIIGIHVGGTDKGYSISYAWSAMITQELINESYTKLEELIEENQENYDFKVDIPHAGVQAAMDLKPYCHSPYKVSKIVPSSISKHLPPSSKAPALLMASGGLDPYKIAIAHYYPRITDIDACKNGLAVMDCVDYYCSKIWSIDTELLTLEEAIYGSDKNPLYSALPSGTSAGAPLKYTNPKYKSNLLGEGAVRNSSNPYWKEFETEMMYRLQCANKGERLEYLYTDNLKDALVSIKKRDSGESRMFSGACMFLALLTKQLYGKSIEFFSKDCLEKGFATTVNPYSEQWKKLAMLLARFSPSIHTTFVLCIDYAKYDSSHTLTTLRDALYVLQSWYRHHGMDDYDIGRATIYLEVTNSRHLVFSEVIEWIGSLPSGSILTLLINGIINQLNLRYCYFKLVPSEITEIYPYHVLIESIVQGDDVILSTHDMIKPFFTAEGITKCMLERGYTVTADKKDQEIGYVHITEATFLKRSFNLEDDQVHAALSLETIFNTPLWSKKGDYYHKITRDTIKFYFRELSLHKKEVFDEYAPAMRQAVQKAKIKDFVGITWDHHKWRESVYNSEPFTVEF